MNLDQDRICPYEDARNITIGLGRIFWGDTSFDISGKLHMAGWVLPGGKRTQNEDLARNWATYINQARLA